MSSASTRSSSRIGLLQTVPVPANPVALAVDAPAGRVFVLSQGPTATNNSDRPAGHASVSILDAATGRLVRTTALGPASYVGGPPNRDQGVVAPLAVDARAGRVFVLQHGPLTAAQEAGDAPVRGQVRLLDAATGRILRTVPAGPDLLTLIADARSGHLFVPSAFSSLPGNGTGAPLGGSVPMLSTATGAPVRVLPVTPDEYQDAPMVDARRGRVLLRGVARTGAGAGADGVVAIDAATGRVARTIPIATSPNSCTPSLAFDEGADLFVAAVGEARATMGAQVLDGASGRVLHTVTLQSAAQGGGIAGDCPTALAADAATGRAFVYLPPPYDGGYSYVAVLDTRGGKVLNMVATGSGEGTSVALAIDHRAGRAFVADTDLQAGMTFNKLTVLDVRGGRALRVAVPPLGLGPPAVAVDEQAKRLFVVNGADGTVSVLDTSHL